MLTKVRKPPPIMLKPLTPLEALLKSTEEIALEPPKAKNVMYWNRIEDVVISAMEGLVD